MRLRADGWGRAGQSARLVCVLLPDLRLQQQRAVAVVLAARVHGEVDHVARLQLVQVEVQALARGLVAQLVVGLVQVLHRAAADRRQDDREVDAILGNTCARGQDRVRVTAPTTWPRSVVTSSRSGVAGAACRLRFAMPQQQQRRSGRARTAQAQPVLLGLRWSALLYKLLRTS